MSLPAKYLKSLYIFALLVTCFFSIGFWHPDEHYQILEYLNVLQNPEYLSSLSWEYSERMRPWFQPYFYYFIVSFLNALKVTNPHHLVFFLRIITAALGFIFLNVSIRALRPKVSEKWQHWVAPLIYCTWFFPYIFARTSSDSLSTIFLMIPLFSMMSLSKENKIDNRQLIFWAVLFSLATLFRYQVLIPVIGIYLWLFRKIKPSQHFLIIGTFTIVYSLEFLANYYGYKGEWVLSPWRHVYVNIFEGKANNFGSDPFFYFLYKPLIKGIPPLSLVLYAGFFFYIRKNLSGLLSLALLPLLVILSCVSHKEVRFILPLIVASPMILVLSLSYFEKWLGERKLKSLLKFYIAGNLLVLIVVIFKPAYKPVKIYQDIYAQNIKTLYTPVSEAGSHLTLPLNYYLPINFKLIPKPLAEIRGFKDEHFILGEKMGFFQESLKAGCKLISSTYSPWVLELLPKKIAERSNFWSLFNCTPKEK